MKIWGVAASAAGFCMFLFVSEMVCCELTADNVDFKYYLVVKFKDEDLGLVSPGKGKIKRWEDIPKGTKVKSCKVVGARATALKRLERKTGIIVPMLFPAKITKVGDDVLSRVLEKSYRFKTMLEQRALVDIPSVIFDLVSVQMIFMNHVENARVRGDDVSNFLQTDDVVTKFYPVLLKKVSSIFKHELPPCDFCFVTQGISD